MSNERAHQIIQTAQRTLLIERDALQEAVAVIDEYFIQLVEAILKLSGRVVVTGIGKSAIVGQKIVATFNSTGTPALFMHAADAIHGDLGMVRPDDMVLCLSKSGETPEIKVLIPLLKNLAIPVAAMASNRESTLARQADYFLFSPVKEEADPNNLAPTTSTTVQMALGDALATSLLALRGFSSSDFSRFHPGGALGKQLYLRVGELASRHAVPAVQAEATVAQLIFAISAGRLGAVAVLNAEQALIGIVTDGDLRRMLQKELSFHALTAVDIMTPNPKRIAHDAFAVEALRAMREANISQLLVMKEEVYVGMVHIQDLLREGLV